MKKVFASVVILTFIWAGAAFAETSIKAEVDKTALTTDEVLTYKVTVISSEKNLPKPQLPEVKGFSVVSQAQSSSLKLAQAQAKSVLSYVFFLLPVEAGDLVIGPASINMGDNIYSTDSFSIKVSRGKNPPKAAPDTRPEPALPESANELPQYNL